jgi:hypothetical protein
LPIRTLPIVRQSRGLFSPLDYTPVAINSRHGDEPNRLISRWLRNLCSAALPQASDYFAKKYDRGRLRRNNQHIRYPRERKTSTNLSKIKNVTQVTTV